MQELICDKNRSNIDILADLEGADSEEAARIQLVSSTVGRDALAARLTKVGCEDTAGCCTTAYIPHLHCCWLAQLLGAAIDPLCACVPAAGVPGV
jgi:hypothetical protein